MKTSSRYGEPWRHCRHISRVVVLRELEGLSDREIATIADIPQGIVMSRLVIAKR